MPGCSSTSSCSAARCSWSARWLVLGEVVARTGVDWDAFVYAVYPVTDVLLAGLAVLLLLRSSGKPRPDLLLIAAAFATWTFADNGFALMSARGTRTTRVRRWTSPTRWRRPCWGSPP